MKYSPYKAYIPENPNKNRRTVGKKFLIAAVLLLLGITFISVLITLLLPLYSEYQEDSKPPVAPFAGESNVKGLFVDPFVLYQYPEVTDEDELTQQRVLITSQIVEYCNTNGINTIFLYTKSSEMVAYSDRNFISAFEDFDPIESISNAAAQQNIATVSVIDLYGAEMSEFEEMIVNGTYSPDNEEYNTILYESLTRLFNRYPISGILINDLSNENLVAVDSLLASLEQALAGRRVGFISDGTQTADFADFALIDAEKSSDATEFTQGIDLYITQGELTISELDYALYNNALTTGNSGIIYGNYGEIDTAHIAKLDASANMHLSEPLPSYQLSNQLTLTNPSSGYLRQTSANCYIMGLSNPLEPLYMNDVEIERLTTSGSFGVLVSLEMGVNTFTFTQGDVSEVAEIELYSYTGGSSSTPHDGTTKAEVGSFVRVSVPIASALYDVSSDANISETLRQDAVFEVFDNVLTTRSGSTTYAYQIASGDWVMAYNTEPVSQDSNICTGLIVEPHNRGERIVFDGLGAPAVFDERLGNRLILTFYDVDFSATMAGINSLVESSLYIDNITIELEENITVVTIDFSSQFPVWGHYIEYIDGNLNLDLIAAPAQPEGLPLEGFVIMVDAGHGDTDTGAPGIASGISGPAEKDLNLNLAKVLEDRLTQLGAEVIMTRTDDTYLTLQERLTLSVTEKPHFFISIHHNSINLISDGNTAEGVEGYYFEENSQLFAEAVNNNVALYTGRVSRGDIESYYYVTRSTGAQSVLYEYGFVINPVEYDNLYSQQGVYSAAYGTAEGFIIAVQEFYKAHFTGAFGYSETSYT